MGDNMTRGVSLASMGGVLASAMLVLSLGACAGGPQQALTSGDGNQQAQDAENAPNQTMERNEPNAPQAPKDTTGGSPWLDSNIEGNVREGMETSPKDDFYLWANYDWLLQTQIPEGSKTAGSGLESEGREHAMRAISGEELEGHDARQAQLFYRAAANTAARDAAGARPAQATVDAIQALATIDDVSAFLLDVERSAGVSSPVRVLNVADPADESRYVTRIDVSPATFGSSMGTIGMDATTVSPEDDLYKARLACASAVLTRCGLTADEAKAAFENRVELERCLIQDSAETDAQGDADSRLKLSELDGLAGAFPLRELVEARGYGAAREFLVADEAELRAFFALYTQNNVELVRDYLLCGYALEASSWLDGQAFQAWQRDYAALGYYDHLSNAQATSDELAFDLTCHALPTPVGRAFVEAYDLGHAKRFVEDLCHEAIESHKELVNASEWLTDASKQRLAEKLDALTVMAVYPEAWEDYSGLDLEGLDYYEVRRATWWHDVARNAALTNGVVDERLWSDPTLIGAVARYMGEQNAFRVGAGAVYGDVERYESGEITYGELIGGPVGYCVFHEIGHAIDSEDMGIDKDGNGIDGSLLEPADQKELDRRVQKARDYYDSIIAFSGQNVVGEVCVNEGLNEMCAHRARLAHAAKQDGFDYRGFYVRRAEMVRGLRTPDFELQCILGGDTHPSAYLDANGAMQMCDEFYETYDVQEGDGMYLAPEDRIVLW